MDASDIEDGGCTSNEKSINLKKNVAACSSDTNSNSFSACHISGSRNSTMPIDMSDFGQDKFVIVLVRVQFVYTDNGLLYSCIVFYILRFLSSSSIVLTWVNVLYKVVCLIYPCSDNNYVK